jgi:predicted Zn-dependent protease
MATLTLALTGASGAVPMRVAATRGQSRDVVLSGAATVSIPDSAVSAGLVTAPDTYGDRQFVRWTWNGASAPNGTTFSWDSHREGSGTLTGVYKERAPGADGFSPNYSQSGSLHWAAFPLRVYFVPSDRMTSQRVSAIREGLDRWELATGGLISYSVVNDAAQANTTIEFATLPAGRLGWTQWTYEPTNRVIHSAAIQLSDQLTDAGGDVPTLRANACHEFGHALGIMNHSTDANDIMYAVANVDDVTVTGRDVDTLLNLYHPAVVGHRAAHTESNAYAGSTVEKAGVP